MVAGGQYFFQIFLHLVPLVDVGDRQGGEAHDGVHGGADIVGHIGQENALGLAGPVGLGERVLQEGLFLHLPAGLLVHIAQAQHYRAYILPEAGADRFHLKVADLALTDRPVVEKKQVSPVQLLPQIFAGKALAQSILVLSVDAGVYVLLHALLQVQFPVKDTLQHADIAVADTQGLSCAGFQIEHAHQAEVDAQSLHQLHLTVLLPQALLVLPELLGGHIQQKALEKPLALLLHEFDAAHHMEEPPVFVPDPIPDVDALPHFFQIQNGFPQLLAVLIHDGGRHHIKAAAHQLLHGAVAQDIQRRTVDADNVGAVDAVAHDAAVQGGE